MKERYDGIARVRGAGDISGTVEFRQLQNGVLITAEISGLPESASGFFGFHIHEGSSCGGADFADTGGHFNPAESLHPRHAGDLPPLMSSGGKAYLQVLTDRFRVEDVIGRTVVIHSNPDDFRSQPAGNAGMKIACGIICRF